MENQIMLGGCPISSSSQLIKNRFENLVVPLGIHMIPFADEFYLTHDEEDIMPIDNKKYDGLLFAVGSDLGKVKAKTYRNKTKKMRGNN
jgi:hypothetical protein